MVERAQRRPGREPRRHVPGRRPWRCRRFAPLNEGRGANPGDTRSASRILWRRAPAALNEGRGANPGDTSLPGACPRAITLPRSTKAGARTPATPTAARWLRSLGLPRSTKAGARTPATRRRNRAGPKATRDRIAAQRRPGREPRRHGWSPRVMGRLRVSLNEGRGANPGDTTHGQGATVLAHRSALNEGRGANPGDTLARCRGSASSAHPAALNEGRGANPGDTDGHGRRGRRPLSTPLNEGRGANPGDTRREVSPAELAAAAHAQRRPGREPRRHLRLPFDSSPSRAQRSTKAGARTPATRDVLSRKPSATCQAPLNEGRGANPGDTVVSAMRARVTGTHFAQRRPGREPRRHDVVTCAVAERPRSPLNEGRGANPGDTCAIAGCASEGNRRHSPTRQIDQSVRSTKAGARTPATRAARVGVADW